MFDRTLFLRSILETLECWPSLQISIANGMGGPNTTTKIEWLCDSIVQLFRDNNHLIVQDLIDFIAEILDNEFDTIIEDGSLEMISESIFGYYQKILAGDQKFVLDKLQQTKEKYTETNKREKERQTLTTPSSLLSCSEQTTTSGQQIATDSLMMMDDDNDNNDCPENDGWTVVRRKK
ncbi:pre-rRNA-processing protein TSR2 homolog [Dermatophagoides farinae]|uniref:Pre-rRNA-processing protein TSR2 homolog n=1 Tax=Dermatophagoides farinae TaxID=6954 RepID=A0A922I1R9_DERFA|nr:pre-rRNA-processing protein TSR2 homolog [Dermatophagoides farinae]KAH7646129.1 pre-rrna-processing protein tsr2-like protein [Dermatophagoides farinae]KAH9516481.1 rRNA accumulation- protein [Dermatophagoides farinae]